ncbi:MAG: phospholipid/cholesterol/gamma-HCH transport system substrate-binding protein, partial [Mycobacterium sp.]|nr:phospholipid/cholesterol/gamma-HCH transport system substrate-binding protein [Mycobacterium sp.]
GRVSQVGAAKNGASLKLEIDPDQVRYIPANVEAQIDVTTAFGAKFVELVYPTNPSNERLAAGAVLHSKNVSTEVNTVFENVVELLKMIDPAKLNSVLTAVADAVRGQGERMGQATTDLNEVLTALNDRSELIRQDWRSFKRFNDTYAAAAQDILTVLDAASTTSTTIVNHSTSLDSLLLNVIGFSKAGTNLLATSKDNLVASVNVLEPTTNLLLKYNPEYTCLLQGATWYLNNGGYSVWGGADGRTTQLDVALLLGNDPYAYPDNLPIVAAKGGPGGKPGCGSLPDASKNFPVRQLVTNTGWGTGVDIRPNPGIGHPCWNNYFPVTRAVPEPPSIRQCIPGPAVGPVRYPGAPAYGAPLYGPGGVPLWPGVPPAGPGPGPAQPNENGQMPP